MVFPGGLEAKALTHEAELRSALTDERFVRGVQHWRALREGTIDANHPMAQMMHIQSLLVFDGDLHADRRRMLADAFSPRAMRTLTPQVRQIVEEQLQELADAHEPVDLKGAFALPVTVRVLCALLGLDETDVPGLTGLIRDSFAGTGLATTDQVRGAITDLVQAKRARPDAYIVTTLIQARDAHGERLSERELIDTVMLLVSAGYETTMGALTNIAHHLLSHPAYRTDLDQGHLSWEQVIEEGLRADGPVNTLTWLFTTEDVAYPDGSVIEAGEAVLMCYLAANRDPARHGTDAADFNPHRERRPHLAFGHGAHHCLGRPLARLELQQALPALFTRFPQLRLAEPGPPEPSVVMNHPRSLLVRTS